MSHSSRTSQALTVGDSRVGRSPTAAPQRKPPVARLPLGGILLLAVCLLPSQCGGRSAALDRQSPEATAGTDGTGTGGDGAGVGGDGPGMGGATTAGTSSSSGAAAGSGNAAAAGGSTTGGAGDGDAQLCPVRLVECAGECVNLNTDPTNCGSCGTTCAAGERCTQGLCTSGNTPSPDAGGPPDGRAGASSQ